MTKVVRERELGKPVERLREQMEKLLLSEEEEEELAKTSKQLKEEQERPVEKLKELMEVLPAAQLKEEELAKIKYADLEFVDLVGSGGFGEVWKGRWKSKDKTVAIKKFKFGEMEREVSH